jgi:nitroreductase
VVLVVAVRLTALAMMDCELDRVKIASGASIYPFLQNILLAARNEGLHGLITTFLIREEEAARPLLGLPPDHAIAGVIVLGRAVSAPTRLRRKRVEEFTTVDRFDGAAFP